METKHTRIFLKLPILQRVSIALPSSSTAAALPQKVSFDAAMNFYDERAPQKRLVARIYWRIWKGIEAYYETLKRIDSEILLPGGLYVSKDQNNHILQEEKLQRLAEDHDRYMDFSKKIERLFDTIS